MDYQYPQEWLFLKKIQKKKGNIYVMMSDGECQEGTTWESLLISTKQNLNNLKIIIDYNKIQALSKLDDALPLNNLINKFKAFNCNTVEIKNGHSFPSIIKALKKNLKTRNLQFSFSIQ